LVHNLVEVSAELCVSTIDAAGGEHRPEALSGAPLRRLPPGSEAGSYLRRIDFMYHSALGVRVIKKKKKSTDPKRSRGRLCADFHQVP